MIVSLFFNSYFIECFFLFLFTVHRFFYFWNFPEDVSYTSLPLLGSKKLGEHKLIFFGLGGGGGATND